MDTLVGVLAVAVLAAATYILGRMALNDWRSRHPPKR